jgi:hypothetical protein
MHAGRGLPDLLLGVFHLLPFFGVRLGASNLLSSAFVLATILFLFSP